MTTTIAANDLSGTWTITPETSTVNEIEGRFAGYLARYTSDNSEEQGETVSILVTVGFTPGPGQAELEDFDGDSLTPGRQPLNSASFANLIRVNREDSVTPSTEISARVTLTIDARTLFRIRVPIWDDAEEEGDETLTIMLSQPSKGSSVSSASASATTTIAANDRGTWTITPETQTVNEGDDASYTVQYEDISTQVTTVSILVTVEFIGENSAEARDFGPEPLTAATLANAIRNGIGTTTRNEIGTTIGAVRTAISVRAPLTTAANGNGSFNITLPILKDRIAESPERFNVTLSEQTTGTMLSTFIVFTTIAASDVGTWAIRTTTPTVNESETASYTVEYNGNPDTRGETVSILVTVEFPPENPAVADDIDGVPGTTRLEPLTSAHLATIIGAGATAGDTGISAVVELTTDAMGDANFSFDLTIADDDTTEGNEIFMVTLSRETTGTDVIMPDATTTIATSDIGGTWTISQAPTAPVNESDEASYTVQYTGNPVTQGATISILVTVGFTGENPAQAEDFVPTLTSATLTQAITGEDVAAVTAGDTEISAMVSLTIAANGNASADIALLIFNDAIQESTETFMVTISDQTPGTTITTASVTTLIGQLEWMLSASNTAISEGDEIEYTLSYSTNLMLEEGQTVSILIALATPQSDSAISTNSNNFEQPLLATTQQNMASEQDDFEQPLLEAILSAANAIDGVTAEPEGNGVRVTFIGQPFGQPTPTSLTFQLRTVLDGFEGNEMIQLTLSDPRLGDEPSGSVVVPTVMVMIMETTAPAADISKLVTPLILRAALPTLSDAVNNHVNAALSEQELPAPQADEQNFPIELSRLIGYQQHQTQPEPKSRWTMWIDGTHTAVNAGHNVDVTGNVFNLWSGVDYRIRPNVIVGGLFGYEHSDMNVDTNEDDFDADMEGDGFAGGAYIGLKLRHNIIADASIVWMSLAYNTSATSNQIRRNASFSAGRLMVTSNVTGTWNNENWRLPPRMRIMWTKEWQDSYLDDGNVPVDQEAFTYSRVSFGSEFASPYEFNDDRAAIEAFVGLEGQLEVNNDVPAATLPGSMGSVYALDPGEVRLNARFLYGLAGNFSSFHYRFEGTLDGIGQESYLAISANVNLTYDASDALQVILQNRYQGPEAMTRGLNTTYHWSEHLSFSLENEYQPMTTASTPLASFLGRINWVF